MFELSEIEKKSIEKRTGLSIEEIQTNSFEYIEESMRKKKNIKVKYAKKIQGAIIARGSVFMNFGRFVFSSK